MPQSNSSKPLVLHIENYISEKKDVILEFIENNQKVLLNSSPGSGKTTFFAELCREHLQKNKSGRIIFCSPFLIIQNQFKIALQKLKISVSLELNSSSYRKKLLISDKVVTSTFKSLKYLENELNPEDLIIIDEAHTLLHSYKKNFDRDYFVSTFKVLFHTQAKVVAMSGTPYSGIRNILKLKELKVIKENLRAKINITYSKEDDSQHVLNFATSCLEEFDRSYLNIIYIKNKRKCDRFKELIETDFECKAHVLTASRKDNDVYEELVLDSTIPKEITFLITTNVISTGANILNKKIGKALMLHEFDPVEIKQFSKRFRTKMNIEIDVVNRAFQKYEGIDPHIIRKELIEAREEKRFYTTQVINAIKSFGKNTSDYIDYSEDFFQKNLKGTPIDLIDTLLERSVIDECYYIRKINQTYNDPDELEQALENYDDIMPTYVADKYNFEYTQKADGLDEIEKLIGEKYKSVINFSIQNSNEFLFSLYKFFHDKGLRFQCSRIKKILKNKFSIEKVPTVLPEKFSKIFKETDFIVQDIDELFRVNEYIKDIQKSLYFLGYINKNQREVIFLPYYVNHFFHKYFIVKTSSESLHPFLSYRDEINMDILENDKNLKSVLSLIKIIFDFGVRMSYINLEELTEFIKKHFNYTVSQSPNLILRKIDVDAEGKIDNINRNHIKGLIHGIFYLKERPQDRQYGEKKNERKSAYLFQSSLPEKQQFLNLDEKEDLDKIHENSIICNFEGSLFTFKDINMKEAQRKIINSNTLLSYSYMGKEFYQLL